MTKFGRYWICIWIYNTKNNNFKLKNFVNKLYYKLNKKMVKTLFALTSIITGSKYVSQKLIFKINPKVFYKILCCFIKPSEVIKWAICNYTNTVVHLTACTVYTLGQNKRSQVYKLTIIVVV